MFPFLFFAIAFRAFSSVLAMARGEGVGVAAGMLFPRGCLLTSSSSCRSWLPVQSVVSEVTVWEFFDGANR
jgi:hypothetical protein